MTAAWQERLAGGAENARQGIGDQLSRPSVQRWLRILLACVLLFWVLRSAVTIVWSFLPPADALPPQAAALNPALPDEARTTTVQVDIDALLEADLFGEADAAALAAAAQQQPLVAESSSAELDGIESNARETRLPLVLMGAVAADDPSLAQAVIEHRGEQRRYRVGDELPVSGRVVLAKVLPTQVVLDNGGEYELLRLFEDSEQFRVAPSGRAGTARPSQASDVAGTGNAGAIAANYRERLYSDPESLTELVTVSDVRADGELVGYRLQPGRAVEAFEALGFRRGDLVTAVNGLPLSDPANALRLYQAMRSADAAVFDVQRGGETLSLTVNLDEE